MKVRENSKIKRNSADYEIIKRQVLDLYVITQNATTARPLEELWTAMSLQLALIGVRQTSLKERSMWLTWIIREQNYHVSIMQYYTLN